MRACCGPKRGDEGGPASPIVRSSGKWIAGAPAGPCWSEPGTSRVPGGPATPWGCHGIEDGPSRCLFGPGMTTNHLNARNAPPELLETQPLPNTGTVVVRGNPDDGWTLLDWNGTPFG